ncbi:enoyl-CoA hydratase/isomerase family protein [Alkalicoccus daliensis]|uniref:Enoyl-CoA hydratase n=1 Tax=Alkalicoccus daliensis TaxID=745820 RepID=A0A1H0L0F4_9BACI|nr:enoyl-CoA hydratase-related protein [Alkalicoccus daliensis]SDO61512.1 Enoyl-CoA hydratase [Alkalicoccus daliensis]
MTKSVLYSVDNKTATISMNRPEVKNAINKEMHEQLYDAFSKANEDPAVNIILFTGTGDAFSSGADLKSIPVESFASFDHGEYLEETYNRLLYLMDRIEKPIVAYINGIAVGAGLSLALACDFRYADPKADFALSFLKIGLVPDAGASYFLPRLVGLAKAIELGTGITIDSEEAKRIGLINGIGYPASFLAQLVHAPLPAYGLMKKNMKAGFEAPLEDILEKEVKAQRIAGKSRAHQKALQAFLQRSK